MQTLAAPLRLLADAWPGVRPEQNLTDELELHFRVKQLCTLDAVLNDFYLSHANAG